ncbi:MAG TPA: MATE family efflux transporter [Candidatus Butyricicoccus stercorigallinarum]|nr:MATE family efflux transporter [Candidatus Butyricicoccus stercorigallinarum]
MTHQAKTDFSQGSIPSNILRLAGPMTLAQLVNVLYNIVDRIYIGRMGADATNALTGLGVCFPIITIVMAFANLVGMGGAPLFSIHRGAGHDEEAEGIMGNCVTLLLLFGVGLTAVGLLVRRPLLLALGASSVTFPYAMSYITIYLTGNVFVMLSLGMNTFINAQGFARTGMLTVMIGAALNLILDPIFIFALHLGVRGAAIATVLSQAAAALWTMRFLTGKRTLLRLRRRHLRLRASRVKRIVTLGLAGFTMNVTNSLVQVACNSSLQSFGGDLYVGVMTVLNSVREIIVLPVNGLSSSAQPVISYNYGAGLHARVRQAIRFLSGLSIVYSLAIWGAIALFPRFFIHIFNTDAALTAAGMPAMHVYFFGFFLMALQFAGQTVFTGLGKSGYAIFFSIFRKGIVVIPLTLLLPHIAGLGVYGVFLAEPVSNLLGGVACFTTMYRTVYRRLEE